MILQQWGFPRHNEVISHQILLDNTQVIEKCHALFPKALLLKGSVGTGDLSTR